MYFFSDFMFKNIVRLTHRLEEARLTHPEFIDMEEILYIARCIYVRTSIIGIERIIIHSPSVTAVPVMAAITRVSFPIKQRLHSPYHQHNTLLRSSSIHLAIIKIVKTGIRVTLPRRKRSRRPGSPKDRKGKDENHNLGPTIQRRRNDIVILDEELRTLPSQIILSEKAQEEENPDGGVDANEEVAHLPKDDGEIHIAEERVREVAVEEPEGDGDDEADDVGYGYPLVFGADREGFFSDGPSNG